jgi:hypothetical protein
MQRSELAELHYITPIANLSSMLQRGILSHVRAGRVPHQTVEMGEIQERRAPKTVPGGRRLHEYVNLYFNARNAMLYKRLDAADNLCVLRVDLTVLDLPGVVVTDQNAGSDYVRFYDVVRGVSVLVKEYLFATYWTHPDQRETWHHKSAMCAEVLVPDRVAPEYILGAHVVSADVQRAISQQVPQLRCRVNGRLFFRG